MQKKIICGIQQIGIGVSNVYEAWEWYRKIFSMDVPVFDEAATASLMLPYTGGKPQKRHAVLALNMKGGAGFEIWQYIDREPQKTSFEIQAGDLGIYCVKMRCPDVQAAYDKFTNANLNVLGGIQKDPAGNRYFFIKDPWDNLFQIVEDSYSYLKTSSVTGGLMGVMIGVSSIDKSLSFYTNLLNYNKILYRESGQFPDFTGIPGGLQSIDRVLLGHGDPRSGAFSRLLGPSVIELIEVKDRKPKFIFENRFWGDLGYIHLCFDVAGMRALRNECLEFGHPFTVDAGDHFDMGDAAGTFAYVEDPDKTLIEFVETHKIPVLKKIGWYLSLKKRNPAKPLPKWMLAVMSLNRVKD